jgi:hypothetical protein
MASCIIKVKGLQELKGAESRIAVQVLTVLTMRFVYFIHCFTSFSVVLGRKQKFFTGALTQGRLWRFFMAYNGGGEIKIYVSHLFDACKDQGFIVEFLKDMVNSFMMLNK